MIYRCITCVGCGVGSAVGASVGSGVGCSVGCGVGSGVGFAVVGFGVTQATLGITEADKKKSAFLNPGGHH